MASFDEEDDDELCDVCGDPLCPGCGESPSRKLAMLAAGILILILVAIGLRAALDGMSNRNQQVTPDDVASASNTTDSPKPSSTAGVTTTGSLPSPTSSTPPPLITSNVNLESYIRSVVQVVTRDASGMCGWGSGTVVRDSKTVVTNLHVVETTPDCLVTSIEIWTVEVLSEQPTLTHTAQILSVDSTSDLALLVLTALSTSSPILQPLAISFDPVIGSELIAVGFPNIGGSSITLAKGIVSGFIKDNDVEWIKTDAAISGGSSGGAALDSDGRLIGVPTMLSSGENGEVVDCRSVSDTNQDGIIDTRDTCVPVGGFLNLLSPSRSVENLLLGRSPASIPGSSSPLISADPRAEVSPEVSDPRFGTCREAKRNGYGPYYQGIDVEYDWYRDRDNDGIVCE